MTLRKAAEKPPCAQSPCSLAIISPKNMCGKGHQCLSKMGEFEFSWAHVPFRIKRDEEEKEEKRKRRGGRNEEKNENEVKRKK